MRQGMSDEFLPHRIYIYIYIQQINNDIYDEGYIHFLLKLT